MRPNYNFEPLNDFFQTEVDPEYITNVIDTLLYDYIIYVTSDKDFCGNKDTSERIYWLKQLSDNIRLCTQEPTEK